MKKLLCCVIWFSALCARSQCWKEVDAAGGEASLGIKTNGSLWTWGYNYTGNMGTGSYNTLPFPAQVGTATTWQSVSLGLTHAAGIQANGTLWIWGDNARGQLGNGTFMASLSPVQLGTATNWQSVSVGSEFTLAIKTNGTLWAWGGNNVGQLGDGTQITSSVPVQIGTDTDWQSISAGDNHSMAIKTNGTLWAWGSNGSGKLGLGLPSGFQRVPVQVGTLSSWQSVCASLWHTHAIQTNGTLWAWGGNSWGQLGDGTTTNSSSPIQIGNATDWASVSSSGAHTIALKTTGTIWTWGNNQSGQLGNGSTISSNVPVQVGTGNTWTRVSGGYDYSFGIQSNGSLWGWGLNNFWQLGLGDTINRTIPTELIYSGMTASASSTVICAGSAVTLSASGATSYTWSSGVSNGVPFVPASSASYTVTGSDQMNCQYTATIAVSLAPNATVTAHATSTAVCTGGTVALNGSGGSAYSWSGGVTDGIPFILNTTTTYTVTNSAGCSNTASITVHALPSPLVSVNSATICEGTNALLTASASPVAGTTYSWSTGATGNPLTVSPAFNTAYTVTATNAGCSSSAIALVSVIPVHVPVTGFSYPSPLCLTASNPLPSVAPGFSPGGMYASGAGSAVDPLSGLLDLSNSSAGTYVITYSVGANGCDPSGSSTFTLVLDAPVVPVTGFSYPSPVCSKDANPSPLLSANFTTGGTFAGSGLAVYGTTGGVDLSNTAPGTYTVTYTVNAANCVLAGTGSAVVTIQATPVLSVGSSTTIITGEQTNLSALSSANTYAWFPTSNLSCSACPSPMASPVETTIYCVTTTDGICTNTACITVSVESLCEGDNGFFLPNAFSPNGDGNNDVFCVQGKNRCISHFQMMVYDRWGEQVFQCSDLSTCWDGTYKGKVLSPDVYVYYIKALDQNQLIKKGNVTLIK